MEENENEVKIGKRIYSHEKKKGCCTVTHKLSILGLFIFFMQYAMRVNMSVTIVPMAEEFQWDEPTQGLVLGAFFYGYVLTNVLGGRAAEVFGGKIVLAASLILTGFFTLLTPIACKWSVYLLVALRVLEGLTEGVAFPAMCFFMTKWIPFNEKSRTGARIFTGNLFGTFITMIVAGWLCSTSAGWPSVFYLTGTLGIILGIVWMCSITDDPRKKKAISDKELKRIVDGCKIHEHEGTAPIPWKEILKSPLVWCITGAHMGEGTSFYIALIQMPTYLVRIYGFSLSVAGTISGASYLLAWFFAVLYGMLSTFLINTGRLELTSSRRISQGISCYGSILGFICLMLTNSASFAVVIFLFNGAVSAARYGGYMVAHGDISPRFSGTVMGFGNTFGNFNGFTVPAIVGAITHNNQTPTAWRYVFLVGILANFIFTTPFVLFFKSEIQPWNSIRRTPEDAKNTTDAENIMEESSTPITSSSL